MTDDELIDKLKEKLTMSGGPFDEGKKDNRNAAKTGSVVDWLTYPDVVYLEQESPQIKHRGKVFVHFKGRERKADYKLGSQTGTNDTQTNGRVSASYKFGRDDDVSVFELTKEGGLGRVGDATVRHVQSCANIVLS